MKESKPKTPSVPSTSFLISLLIAGSMAAVSCSGTGGSGSSGGAGMNKQPDLQLASLDHSQVSVEQGNTLSASYQVENVGPGAVVGSFRVGVYLSDDVQVDTSDVLIGYQEVDTGVGPAASVAGVIQGGVQVAAGQYYVGAIVDDQNAIIESDEFNNYGISRTNAGRVTVLPPALPDLVLTLLTHGPDTVQPGEDVTIAYVVYNQGSADAGKTTIAFYASTDDSIDSEDIKLGSVGIGTLQPMSGAQGSEVFSVLLQPGVYWVGALVDADSQVKESIENNNVAISSSSSGTVTVASPPVLPDLEPVVVRHDSGTVLVGGLLTISDTVVNNTITSSGRFRIGFYASPDATITNKDQLIGYRFIDGLGGGAESSDVNGFVVSLAPGAYYVGGVVDDQGVIGEEDEGNNAIVSAFGGGQVVVAAPPTKPDLVAEQLSHDLGSIVTGSGVELQVDFDINNAGGVSSGVFTYGFYLSADIDISTTDYLLGFASASRGLGAGSGIGGFKRYAVNAPPGVYYVGMIIDVDNDIDEESEQNNSLISEAFSGKITVLSAPANAPDLVVKTLFHSPQQVTPDGTLNINSTVANIGTASAGMFRQEYYLSRDAVITSGDYDLGGRVIQSLAGGGTDFLPININLGNRFARGTYYIGSIVDVLDSVAESDEGNNVALSGTAGGVVYVASPPPMDVDLQVVDMVHDPGTTIKFPFGYSFLFNHVVVVHNEGSEDSPAFDVGVYASHDDFISALDVPLTVTHVPSLAAGKSVFFIGSARLDLPPGWWNVGAVVDSGGDVPETIETNNSLISRSWAGGVDVHGVDFVVDAVTHSPGSVSNGGSLSVDFVVRNAGDGCITPMNVGIYASTDPIIDTNDVLLDSDLLIFGLAGGQVYKNQRSFSVALPAGSYYLGVLADSEDDCEEASEANNWRVSDVLGGLFVVQ